MKGIILAGGSGTRLYPLTISISKQLLPIYDKPMIYYPLSMLMLAGIKDILIISTPLDTPKFEELLGNGENLGIRLSYKIQPNPDGLAQAFILGEDFIGKDCVCMILGDNIFYGDGMKKKLLEAVENTKKGKATVFGYFVQDPERFGVVGFNKDGKINSIEEKPKNPASHYAVTGLYFYDNRVAKIAKEIKPSNRGELEIASINKEYLKFNDLNVVLLGRGYTWIDAGTHESLSEASEFVRIIETRQGIQISCLEEISYKNGWISKEQLLLKAEEMKNSPYGKHLLRVVNDDILY